MSSAKGVRDVSSEGRGDSLVEVRDVPNESGSEREYLERKGSYSSTEGDNPNFCIFVRSPSRLIPRISAA